MAVSDARPSRHAGLYGESFPPGKASSSRSSRTGPAAELPDARYPLILNTGRVLYHWHGGTMTRRAAGLLERYPISRISVHPKDARRFNVDDGEEVIVASRRGKLTAKAMVTEAQREGEVFIPFVRLAESAANFLTNDALDPDARIPEYKVCAVRLWKASEGGSRGAERGRGPGFWPGARGKRAGQADQRHHGTAVSRRRRVSEEDAHGVHRSGYAPCDL